MSAIKAVVAANTVPIAGIGILVVLGLAAYTYIGIKFQPLKKAKAVGAGLTGGFKGLVGQVNKNRAARGKPT